ncbi:MAG: response regulator [Pseudomonadota bacterium]
MPDIRLLLVDDEVEFLEPMAKRLERRGIACTKAACGEEALAALASGDYHCAVVDVKMPGMDGLELLRRMRRQWPNVAVVLLTGHASVELGVKGMEMGAFEYLLKPAELDELLDTIKRAAGKI